MLDTIIFFSESHLLKMSSPNETAPPPKVMVSNEEQ